MLGALIGDVVGSRFEKRNYKAKDFELFTFDCYPTDDSIMTLAIANAFMECPDHSIISEYAVKKMREFGNRYYDAGYGKRFRDWLRSDYPKPYNSWGNGAAMRISPVAYIADDVDQLKRLSRAITEVTHNHPEGVKGAEAVSLAIWCALHKWTMEEIREYILQNYYSLDFTLDQIRDDYAFCVSCQKSVPQALEAFFESVNFEDAIRNAISIGGDSDTIACITGSIAGAYYGVPKELEDEVFEYFDPFLSSVIIKARDFFAF